MCVTPDMRWKTPTPKAACHAVQLAAQVELHRLPLLAEQLARLVGSAGTSFITAPQAKTSRAQPTAEQVELLLALVLPHLM